jgi:hypothetical protein
MEIYQMSGMQGISWREKVKPHQGRVTEAAASAIPNRFNLLSIPWLRALLLSPWPLFLARALTLAGFIFTIMVGLLGTRVGSHNFAIIFVWIAWWTALKLLFIPLGGRSWCSVCPLPLPGEWLRQGGIFEKGKHRLGLDLRWSKRLKGSWLQSSGFLLVGLFSAVTLTETRVTAWVLLALFGLAFAMSLIFERRAFCTQLCPIGGFTGIYAKTAPVELRVEDSRLCASHNHKTCYHNCPWGVYPLALRDNAQCGLCLECLRACPSDNIALYLRPFGEDIGSSRQSARLDEAFLALVMIGSALAFTAVFSGPWGGLKTAAFAIGSTQWLFYALGFLALNLVLLPAAFSLAVWLGQVWSGGKLRLRIAFSNQAQALLPLGLFAWIAFTVSFAFPKSHYVASVISDPFGWGWNLLGTANPSWSLDGAGFSPLLQVALLLVGLTWSANVASRLTDGIDRQSKTKQALPLGVFCFLFTLCMLWLLVG